MKQGMPPPGSSRTITGLLGRCFGTILDKRDDAKTGGRLGVSLSRGRWLSNV